jgi:hypothetical protein
MNTHKKVQKVAVPEGSPADQTLSPNEPSVQEIRALAYELYIQRGRIDGFEVEDWLQAEKELKLNHNKPKD